jgi:hypothetical protein
MLFFFPCLLCISFSPHLLRHLFLFLFYPIRFPFYVFLISTYFPEHFSSSQIFRSAQLRN